MKRLKDSCIVRRFGQLSGYTLEFFVFFERGLCNILMKAFSQNISWNKYETALLIDSYLRIKAGDVKKRNAVLALSARLRNRMLLNGIEISEKYRNESGVVLQMSSIDFLFTNGQHGLKSSNALFTEMYRLYHSDHYQFNVILAQAEKMYPSSVMTDEAVAETEINSQPQQKGYSIHENKEIEIVAESVTAYQDDVLLEQIKIILSQYFVNGYRLDSKIEEKRFLRFYQQKFNKAFGGSSEALGKKLEKCGINCSGKVFIPEQLLPVNLREEIKSFIDSELNQYKPCVYYKILFNHFRDKLLDTLITDEHILQICLMYFYKDLWHFSENSISTSGKVRVNIDKEVINFVKEKGCVVSEEEVVHGLSFLPADKVCQAFVSNKDILISCGRKKRFHIDLFVISNKDINIVNSLIGNAIKQYKFITADELFKDIQQKIPSILSDNTSIPDLGIRNAIASKLEYIYSFNGPIISDKRDNFSAADALLAFAHQKESFTLDDIDNMALLLNVPLNPYLKSLLEFCVRINENTFVAKNKVSFDANSTDNAISILMGDNHYLPIRPITNFSIFPECGYPWTQRLLESYLLTDSYKYTLLYSSFLTKNNVCGAIVKKDDHQFQNFDDVAAQVLADSRLTLTKENALNYLSQNGYIVQRRYGELNKVISRANALRINR